MSITARAVENAARHGYGRIVARLAARTGDIAAAEDHVAAAFELALRTWPRDGIPRVPEAWLLAVAKRKHVDGWRQSKVARAVEVEIAILSAAVTQMQTDETDGPVSDDRLKLMFAVAHPAIDANHHSALMLQTVLGIDAARIASAYLVSPSTMAQRLVRAKTKIRVAGVPFSIPDADGLPERLPPVMDAIFAAFGIAWHLPGVTGEHIGCLAPEAIWLARVLVALMPEEPEPKGLLALMLYSHARHRARVDESGLFVPLSEQNVGRWDAASIAEAEMLLQAASETGRPGRFQIEAAIQSVYAGRIAGLTVDWSAAARLQAALQRLHPTLGGHVAHAAALGLGAGPHEGLAMLDSLRDPRLDTYQPYWAVRADLLSRLPGRKCDARAAYTRAIGLTDRPAERGFLIARMNALLP